VYEIREQDGVSDEEDGGVVSNHVPDSILSEVLQRKSTRIPSSISATTLTADGRKAGEDRSALSDLGKYFCLGILRDIGGDLEISVRTSSLCVHNALGNALSVEMSQLVDEMSILHQDRTIDSANGESRKSADEPITTPCHFQPTLFYLFLRRCVPACSLPARARRSYSPRLALLPHCLVCSLPDSQRILIVIHGCAP
jgi:hypothetical protein